MDSKQYSLNIEDFKKILVGALIAIAGAFLTYLLQVVGQIDFGTYTPLVVALSSIAINAARKYIAGN